MLRSEIGLFISDFRVLYRCSKILNDLGVPYSVLRSQEEVEKYTVVLTTENIHKENVVVVVNDEVDVRRAIPYLYNRKKFKNIFIGIDPGKTIGLAILGDGFVLEKKNVYSVDSVDRFIKIWIEGYPSENYVVRIGNGSPAKRNEIIRKILGFVDIEVVNEHSTSITKEDADAAVKIAKLKGRKIRKIPMLNISEGNIKDIQRISRIESSGKITISKHLAKEVLLGNITLQDAIEKTLKKN